MQSLHRRRLILATAMSSALGGCQSWGWRAPEKGPVAVYLPEADNDSGAEAAYNGVLRIRDKLKIPVTVQRSVGPAGLASVLRNLAASDASMVLAYGDEAGVALRQISAEFPAQRFSLIQATTSGAPYIASYSVAYEQSAWLAGTAAGLLSRKKILGHIGGARSEHALLARAAFYQGLQTSLPQAKFLSSFGSTPTEITNLARAQIAAGAEIIFHTLDNDTPLVALARQHNIPLIGCGQDWLVKTPRVYAAAAIADPGVASFHAGQDLYDGLWKAGINRRIGVENPQAVRLKLAEQTPPTVQQRVGLYQRELVAGGYKISPRYDGPEFKA